MVDFKEYIANSIVGKKLRFKCDCLIRMDIKGTVMSVILNENEFLYQVQTQDGKIITIGSNHPDLQVSEVSDI